MSNFFDEIAARLSTLTGSATPKESLEELNEFDVRDIQAVRVSEGGGGGSQAGLRWRKVTSITFEDTPADGTVLDLVAVTAGMVFYDVFFVIQTAWTAFQASVLSIGVGLDGEEGKWIGSDNPWPGASSVSLPLDLSEDDDARMTGNVNAGGGLMAKGIGVNGGNTPFLPTVFKQSVTVQALYNDIGDPITQGEADIWMLLQDAA